MLQCVGTTYLDQAANSITCTVVITDYLVCIYHFDVMVAINYIETMNVIVVVLSSIRWSLCCVYDFKNIFVCNCIMLVCVYLSGAHAQDLNT